MKVENHNGVGNPNHDDNTGQFSSSGGGGKGSNPLFKRKNVANKPAPMPKEPVINREGKRINAQTNTGEKLKKGKNLNMDEYKYIKDTNSMDNYKKVIGANTADKQGMVDPRQLNQNSTLRQNSDAEYFKEVLRNLSNSALVKTIKFIMSGFDFNKFKSKGGRLNSKVFSSKPKPVEQTLNATPQKVTNEEMQDLHKEGVAINNEKNQINASIEHINELKNIYETKFGRNKKMFENWWNKSSLKKNLIKNKQRQHELLLKEKEFNDKEQNIKNRILQNNQFVKKEG